MVVVYNWSGGQAPMGPPSPSAQEHAYWQHVPLQGVFPTAWRYGKALCAYPTMQQCMHCSLAITLSLAMCLCSNKPQQRLIGHRGYNWGYDMALHRMRYAFGILHPAPYYTALPMTGMDHSKPNATTMVTMYRNEVQRKNVRAQQQY